MLDDLITPHALYELAGAAAFQRGEAYFSEGAVGHLIFDDDAITARVQGTATYRVELSDDDDELAYDCTCPRAADGYFCKHCVAVGLAWLAERARTAGSGRDDGPGKLIREYLAAQPAETLVQWLLDAARRDEGLHQSLLLKARSGGKKAVAGLRDAIDQATTLRGEDSWADAQGYADRIERVVDALADLLAPEMAAEVAAELLDLAEYAIERVEMLMGQVDEEGEFSEILEELCRLHLEACELAAPDPTDLAQRLFDLEMNLPFQICQLDVSTHQTILGEVGLRAYRKLAEAAWTNARPGDYRITAIMERLARLSGDVDELLAVKARDLTSAYRYLVIAEILAEAGRDDEALEWAERGGRAYPKQPDNRLRDFLVAAYLRRQRHDEALALTWVQFEERPTLEHYQKLSEVTAQVGIWPAQRERALALIETMIRREAESTNAWKPQPSQPNTSPRVEIALWEQDLDTAWNLVNQGICDRRLLITLAGKLEAARAEDAITLYQRVVPPIVEQTNNHAYAEATALVRRIGALLQARRKAPEFVNYLIALRARYKAKRNFIKLLGTVS